jgi:ribosomal protein S18 acetylase RimI-like enzyme
VSDKNAGARAFYEALGLRVVGRRPKFYNDGSDAVLMDLILR